jgi:actin related protein 2/3 complex subunit 1A/1B|uniref:Actin-related protein 2/3 complex subunit n=1 Tax=Panagrolaimus sp. PS1159 TaxID=55785 RepID=A0AC35G613_9BILA
MSAAPIKNFKLDKGPIHAHAFNADRSQVAISVGNENVYILHLVGGKWIEKHVLSEHDMAVTSIDWAPKTNRIVTCSRDKNAYVWTYENNKWNACLVLAKLTFAATCVKWSPHENKFAVGSSQKLVSICHYEKENNWWIARQIKTEFKSTISCVSWHPENVLLAVGCYDYKARVFSAYVKDVEERPSPNPWGSKMNFGNLMAQFKTSAWIKDISFSPYGHKLCWINQDSTVSIVDAMTDATKVIVYYGKSLPLRTLMWINEDSFITAGFNCLPYLYTFKNGKIEEPKELDVQAEKSASSGNSAMLMFKNLAKKGTGNVDSALPTLHQNCITQVLPYQGTPQQGVTSFSTVGFDSQLVIWPIKGR